MTEAEMKPIAEAWIDELDTSYGDGGVWRTLPSGLQSWRRKSRREYLREVEEDLTEHLKSKAGYSSLGWFAALQLAWRIYQVVRWAMKRLRERK